MYKYCGGNVVREDQQLTSQHKSIVEASIGANQWTVTVYFAAVEFSNFM